MRNSRRQLAVYQVFGGFVQNQMRKSTTSILSSLPCSIWPQLTFFFWGGNVCGDTRWEVGVAVLVNGNKKRRMQIKPIKYDKLG